MPNIQWRIEANGSLTIAKFTCQTHRLAAFFEIGTAKETPARCMNYHDHSLTDQVREAAKQ
jgi:hypothetical protein